jgi:type VI secretion system secreted protein Hcp
VEHFLRLDGIPGDSTDAKHANEIVFNGFEWDLNTPGDLSSPAFGEIHVAAKISKASPLLMQNVASQAVIADGDFTFRRSGGAQIEFIKLDLDNARISSYRQTTAVTGGMTEEFTIRFDAYTLDYRYQNISGATVSVTDTYDVMTQGGSVQQFVPPQRAMPDLPVTNTADRYFLRLDGIVGESTDAKHAGQIDVLAFEDGLDSPAVTAAPVFHELHINVKTSKASPVLLDRLVNGTVIPDGDLTVVHSGGTQNQIYSIDLDNAVVSSYRIVSQSDSSLREEITFRFDGITHEYRPVLETGQSGTPITFSTPVAPGAVQDFAPPQRSILAQPISGSLNLFLTVDGIPGHSSDAKHPSAIDLRTFEWSVDGRANGLAPRFNEFHVAANVSIATPKFMEALAQDRLIPLTDLIVRRNTTSQFEFFKFFFDDTTVSSHRISSGGGTLVEEVSFSIGRVIEQVIPQKVDGTADTPITFSYDLGLSGGSVADFVQSPRSLLYNDLVTLPTSTSMFLELDGILGESTDPDHVNDIDVLSFDWGGDRDTEAPAEGGPDFAELRLVTRVNRSITPLLQKLATGNVIPSGRLVVRNNVSGSEYLSIDLDGLMVSSHQLLDAGNGFALQEIVLSFDHPLDVMQPSVVGSEFLFETAQQIQYAFNENVGASLSLGDFGIVNLTTGLPIPSSQLALSYNFFTNVATITAPGVPGGILADGNYRVVIDNASVTDFAGNPLLPATNLDFYVLAGDANRDRKVDVADLGIFASNWQQSPRTFSQGNFDYSANGLVDVNDLGILASNWQKQLPQPSPGLRSAFNATRGRRTSLMQVLAL